MAAEGNVKARQIEINDETAGLLEARAAALGISVAELMALIVGHRPTVTPPAGNDDAESADGEAAGTRWREVKAWIDSWGKANELPRPKLGK
jgi:hypothetical protein